MKYLYVALSALLVTGCTNKYDSSATDIDLDTTVTTSPAEVSAESELFTIDPFIKYDKTYVFDNVSKVDLTTEPETGTSYGTCRVSFGASDLTVDIDGHKTKYRIDSVAYRSHKAAPSIKMANMSVSAHNLKGSCSLMLNDDANTFQLTIDDRYTIIAIIKHHRY